MGIEAAIALSASRSTVMDQVSRGRLRQPLALGAIGSDGMTETEEASGSEFGLERMERLLKESGSHSLKDAANKIITEWASFGIRKDNQSLSLIRITKQSEQ
jgi:hypothetical protein